MSWFYLYNHKHKIDFFDIKLIKTITRNLIKDKNIVKFPLYNKK